jgi:hypothetical protein
MEASDFLLSIIKASGGVVHGRTLMQKRCYFVAVLLHMEEEFGFQAHYYGPYSAALDSALSQLVGVGFVEESRIGFGASDSSGFEIRRHDYKLTPDGEVVADLLESADPSSYGQTSGAVQKLREAGEPTYFELSIAAKAFYIIRNQKRPVTREEISREAEGFGWNIEPQALGRAIEFLEKIPLVEARKRHTPG